METFGKIIAKLNEDYEQTVARGTGDAYSKLSTIFEELGKYLREYIQAQTGADIKMVINKLRSGKDLSDEEMELIKLWIVGDAQYYTQLENNVKDWGEELKRLVAEIARHKDSPATVETASYLRGLFRDGSRVITDIFYYLEQKDRIARFQEASWKHDLSDRAILINLLEQKITSPDF
ncbi:MAG TPA: hypothetical protein P5160_09775 [Candidatus Omnitrophota bacterium]|jgi:sulfur relay (sulfurtransferase) DsrC/TusE family protein|nr:hypothetical protein [Candidatus Omnitrophota bacterium]